MKQPRILMIRVGGWEEWVHTAARFLSQSGFEVQAAYFAHGTEAGRIALQTDGYKLAEIIVPRSGAGKSASKLKVARAVSHAEIDRGNEVCQISE